MNDGGAGSKRTSFVFVKGHHGSAGCGAFLNKNHSIDGDDD